MEELTFWQQYGSAVITLSGFALSLIVFHLSQMAVQRKKTQKEIEEKQNLTDNFEKFVKKAIKENADSAKQEKQEEQETQLKLCRSHSRDIGINRDLSLMTARGVDIIIKKLSKEKINGEFEDYDRLKNKIFDNKMKELNDEQN